MQIVNINQVRGNKNNPRVIKDERFKKLVESIKYFPEMLWKRNLVVESNEKGFTVLGGNQRLRAINEIFKMPRHELQEQIAGVNNEKTILAFYDSKQVPITLCDDWTLEQKREFIVRDNIDFGQWDMDKLSTEYEMEELDDWGLEAEGLDKNDLPAELENDSVDDADKIKTDIKLGDLIEIGKHRLFCGDSENEATIKQFVGSEFIDMVFTDPPYNMDMGGNDPHNPDSLKNSAKISRERISELVNFEPEKICFIKEMNIGSFYICTSKDLIPRYFKIFEGLKFNILIWNKTNTIPFVNGTFQPTIEYIMFFSKDKIRVWNNKLPTEIYSKFYTSVKEEGSKEDGNSHPTIKPQGLILPKIMISSKENGIVFDLFGGSGSTMVAAETLKRKCFMIEKETHYCQVIINRMRKNFPELEIKINGKEYKEG